MSWWSRRRSALPAVEPVVENDEALSDGLARLTAALSAVGRAALETGVSTQGLISANAGYFYGREQYDYGPSVRVPHFQPQPQEIEPRGPRRVVLTAAQRKAIAGE